MRGPLCTDNSIALREAGCPAQALGVFLTPKTSWSKPTSGAGKLVALLELAPGGYAVFAVSPPSRFSTPKTRAFIDFLRGVEKVGSAGRGGRGRSGMSTAAELVNTLVKAMVVFVSTNVDDIVLLSVLFADQLRPRSIVAGQFLGMSVLVVVSASAASLAVAIPPGWTSLLGVVRCCSESRRVDALRSRGTDDDDDSASPRQTCTRLAGSR